MTNNEIIDLLNKVRANGITFKRISIESGVPLSRIYNARYTKRFYEDERNTLADYIYQNYKEIL